MHSHTRRSILHQQLRLRTFLAGFLLLVSGLARLQAQINLDSLARVWKDPQQPDTCRLQAAQTIMWSGGLMTANPDSSYQLADGQLKLSRQTGAKKWEGKALYNIATYYYWKGEYAKALSFYQQSLEVRHAIGDLKGEAAIYGNFGLIYGQQGNNLKALDFLLLSLDLNQKLQDTSGITANYNNLAIIYHEQSKYDKALEYYNKSLSLYDPVKHKKEIALTYNNISSVYGSNDMPRKALEYLWKSLEVRMALQDNLGMAINYTNIGSNYSRLSMYDSAMIFVQLGAGLFEVVGDKAGISNAWYYLGEIAYKQKKYNQALKWSSKALALAEEIDRVPIQRVACLNLYETYKTLGRSDQALTYFEKYKLLSDSLKKGEIDVKLKQLEFDKDILTDSLSREKEKEQIKVAYQADLNKKTQTRNMILIASVGILLLALVFLSRMLYFQKRSEKFQDKTQRLENQQLINEVALLKTQVNPHFLFNSLSILSSLVHVDANLSEQFIDQLSRSYRYILEQKDQTLVTLRTELEFIQSYAFLLKIRFENKFDLRIQLSEADLDQYKIAPLTLQLLVENAVKHNRMSVSEPLIVEVSRVDNFLIVQNRLQLRPQREDSTRMGLNNIIHRYALITDRPVWAGEQEERFVVRIPLLQN